MSLDVCPACGASALRVVFRQPQIPVNSCVPLEDPAEALAFPRGDLDLALCDACGFLTNAVFDPALAEYSARYEETQGFSPRFRAFARDLAKRWVATYDLYGKDVLEIGCGKGEFLVMMLEEGVGRGIGIDPGVHPERIDNPAAERATWIADFYSDEYAHLQADAIVCRHTLEHIHPVGDFMRLLRRNIGDRTDTVVLFELPDVLRVLREAAFWDVYYEHCSYFSAGSLERLFRATGFEVLDVALDYDDQYLIIEARPADVPAGGPEIDDLDDVRTAADAFAGQVEAFQQRWRDRIVETHHAGEEVVLWGSGSKAVAFLVTLGLGDEISGVVDINPYKHGLYLPASGHEIIAPERLTEIRPDLVIAMNPIYRDEIQADLDRLGVHAKLEAV